MPKLPEISHHKEVLEVPELVTFLNLRPDEDLRITRVKRNNPDEITVEVVKLETPIGTDDTGVSGLMFVTREIIAETFDYMSKADLLEKSEMEKRRFDFIRSKLNEIKYHLKLE